MMKALARSLMWWLGIDHEIEIWLNIVLSVNELKPYLQQLLCIRGSGLHVHGHDCMWISQNACGWQTVLSSG